MKRTTIFQRVTTAALCVAAVALFLTVSLPHHHDTSSVSHATQSCRICKIHEAFSVATTGSAIGQDHLASIVFDLFRGDPSPRPTVVVRSASPRAPPQLS